MLGDGAMFLDYESQPRAQTKPATPRQFVVKMMGIAWILNAMLSGIWGDRTTIPLEKKVAITTSATLIIALLCTIPDGARWVFWFILISFFFIAIMWFWN